MVSISNQISSVIEFSLSLRTLYFCVHRTKNYSCHCVHCIFFVYIERNSFLVIVYIVFSFFLFLFYIERKRILGIAYIVFFCLIISNVKYGNKMDSLFVSMWILSLLFPFLYFQELRQIQFASV